MFWVSWPKGGQVDTDLSLTKVICIGYECRLVKQITVLIKTRLCNKHCLYFNLKTTNYELERRKQYS